VRRDRIVGFDASGNAVDPDPNSPAVADVARESKRSSFVRDEIRKRFKAHR
jgi:hypothetical protein